MMASTDLAWTGRYAHAHSAWEACHFGAGI